VGFDPAKAPDDRLIEVSCNGQLWAAPRARRLIGQNGPRQDATVGRNGSLLVGC
jgi:hypothetical protein